VVSDPIVHDLEELGPPKALDFGEPISEDEPEVGSAYVSSLPMLIELAEFPTSVE
jgi:hypothetical protein